MLKEKQQKYRGSLRVLAHTQAFCQRRFRFQSWWFWQLDFGSRGRKMSVSDRQRRQILFVLLCLRRKYRDRVRQHRVHPLLAMRYIEGSFYTLFEKLRSDDDKFFNYFHMSTCTFDFLMERLGVHINNFSACAVTSRNMCQLP